MIIRHCTNPIPAFGGKSCLQNPDYKYLSHEKAEIDSADCITEMTINKHHGEELTPWCPENCVVTEWSAWSKCHPECIISPVTKFSKIKMPTFILCLGFANQIYNHWTKRKHCRSILKIHPANTSISSSWTSQTEQIQVKKKPKCPISCFLISYSILGMWFIIF